MEDRERPVGDARVGHAHASRRVRGPGVQRGLVALLALGVVAGAACARPKPAASPPPGSGPAEAMPVRAYPESGAAVDPDSALRAELLAMGREDQAVRTGLSPEMIADTAFVRRLMRTDTALSVRLREMVETGGWPDARRVGADAVRAAFLVVQHTPFEDFREAMLPHLERDVRAGVLEGQDYALMVDRIRRRQGQPQVYGSQYSLVDGELVRDPVEDPQNLDRRRAALGMTPIDEYERMLSEYYDAPVSPAP